MHRKPDYRCMSDTALRRRLLDIILDAKAMSVGKSCSFPSLVLKRWEFLDQYAGGGNFKADSILAHYAELHKSDCISLAKKMGLFDTSFEFESRYHRYSLHYISEWNYVRSIRRFLKALKYSKIQFSDIEASMLLEMEKFVREYDEKPYRELIQLGLRDENVQNTIREVMRGYSDNPRRVVLMLAKHEDVNVRLFVAKQHDRIDVNILNILTNDSDYRVRGEASWTPETFQNLLGKQVAMAEWLLTDPNREYENLQKRYEDDKALFVRVYGTKNIPTVINATIEEYRDGMRAYEIALARHKNLYCKRYHETYYWDELTVCSHNVWWQIDTIG